MGLLLAKLWSFFGNEGEQEVSFENLEARYLQM